MPVANLGDLEKSDVKPNTGKTSEQKAREQSSTEAKSPLKECLDFNDTQPPETEGRLTLKDFKPKDADAVSVSSSDVGEDSDSEDDVEKTMSRQDRSTTRILGSSRTSVRLSPYRTRGRANQSQSREDQHSEPRMACPSRFRIAFRFAK